MTQFEDQPIAGHSERSLSRRTIVKGAAWSLPVVAAAVAVPMATASGQPWNVSIAPGCLFNAGGAAQAGPGFDVAVDAPSSPIPATLTVQERAAGEWSITLPAPDAPFVGTVDPTKLPGFELAFGAFTLAYASAVIAAVLVPAAFSLSGPKVNADLWVTPSNIGEYFTKPEFTRTYSGSGAKQTVTLTVTWSVSRNVTLVGLQPGDRTGWGYIAGVVPPDVRNVPGFDALDSIIRTAGVLLPVIGSSIVSAWNTAVGAISPVLQLTATGQWTDAKADHTAILSNFFTFTCR